MLPKVVQYQGVHVRRHADVLAGAHSRVRSMRTRRPLQSSSLVSNASIHRDSKRWMSSTPVSLTLNSSKPAPSTLRTENDINLLQMNDEDLFGPTSAGEGAAAANEKRSFGTSGVDRSPMRDAPLSASHDSHSLEGNDEMGSDAFFGKADYGEMEGTSEIVLEEVLDAALESGMVERMVAESRAGMEEYYSDDRQGDAAALEEDEEGEDDFEDDVEAGRRRLDSLRDSLLEANLDAAAEAEQHDGASKSGEIEAGDEDDESEINDDTDVDPLLSGAGVRGIGDAGFYSSNASGSTSSSAGGGGGGGGADSAPHLARSHPANEAIFFAHVSARTTITSTKDASAGGRDPTSVDNGSGARSDVSERTFDNLTAVDVELESLGEDMSTSSSRKV